MERAKPISDVTTKRSRVFFKSLKQSAYARREETREREGPGKRKETRREYYFKGEHSMRLISPSRRVDNDNVSTARGEKMGRIFERGKKYDAKVSANTTLPRRYNKNVFFSFLFYRRRRRVVRADLDFSAEAMARRADARVGLADADGGGAALLFAGTPPLVVVAIEVW